MHYGEIKQKLLEKEDSSMVINLREEAAPIYEPCGGGFWVYSFWTFFSSSPLQLWHRGLITSMNFTGKKTDMTSLETIPRDSPLFLK